MGITELNNKTQFNPHILFHHPRTHLRVCQPFLAISLLIVIEPRNKDQRIAWDISKPLVCEFIF